MTWRKNAVLRKGAALLQRGPRAIARATAGRRGFEHRPPVIANSFPKSGTHLLVQILEGLPGVRSYGNFLASVPPIRFRERTQRETFRRIDALAPGELLAAHLFFSTEYANALTQKRAVHYFIFRDPRDVIISEAFYLTHMSRWHRMHRPFQALASDDARIMLAIRGEADVVPERYPDVASRFHRYAGWLTRPDVFKVRFEDLVSDRRATTVSAIVRFYVERTGLNIDIGAATREALVNIEPKHSRTFRRGEAGDWKDILSQQHATAVKEVAGDLLIELGYERGLSW